jgi:gamma-glutamyltranspeptidase / glutathione hydrolase
LFSHHRIGHPIAVRRHHGLGTVVGARESAVTAGLAMFEHGGNAVDATVAAALVAGVVEPAETTLAGSGFLLVQDPQSGPWSVEFGPLAPLSAYDRMYRLDPDVSPEGVVGLCGTVDLENLNGARAAGVPRVLLGLLTAQQMFGVLPRKQVCLPAIEAAYNGFEADSWFVTSALADLKRLRADPVSANAFLEGGLPKGATGGSQLDLASGPRARITQPLLGATLEEVSQGSLRRLVDGAIAQHMVDSSTEHGGLLSMEDLARAEPDIRRPMTARFRDADVFVPTAPGGGITLLEILAIWEAIFPDGATSLESPQHAKALALAIRHAFADRYHWLGDPDMAAVPVAELLSSSYIAEIAALCRSDADVPGWGEGLPWQTYAARPAHNPWGCDDQTAPSWSPAMATAPSSGTTHISAAGPDGRVVSVTHTAANHFGSGVTCPRTGLLFDAAMAWFNAAPGAANSIAGGKRALANMSPALVAHGNGPVTAIGASGGRRIISAVAQVIINLIDGQMNPADALASPRMDASGEVVLIDARRAGDAQALSGLGARVIPDCNDPFVMDLARPNLAVSDIRSGETTSAIASMAYSR